MILKFQCITVVACKPSCQVCYIHYLYVPLTRRKVLKSVCGGGGGGAHRHIYVPSVKNQYKRVVFGYMVI